MPLVGELDQDRGDVVDATAASDIAGKIEARYGGGRNPHRTGTCGTQFNRDREQLTDIFFGVPISARLWR